MIRLVFTGGTISMREDPVRGGAVPALSSREIVAATRGITGVADTSAEDWGAFPGPHMTMARMWALREHLRCLQQDPRTTGIVVTHGTDTLEESAYLMARSLPAGIPVVFTGAMRHAGELGWDGPANLLDAVRVAAAPAARGYGALVAMGGRIYSGLDVTKVHTHLPDAFDSPGLGPVGVVDEGEVIFRRSLAPSGSVLDVPTLAEPVDIIPAYAGADSRLLDAARAEGRGVVLAALGRGNVPPGMVPGIERWLAAGRPVVVASRVGRGRVGRSYGYEGGGRRLAELGVILAAARRPQQARVDLMLALGGAYEGEMLREALGG